MTTTFRRFALAAVVVAIAACGKSPTVPSPNNTPQVQTNTITITAAGANPRNIQIALGTRVMFVNNDSRPHNMASDPHPDHSDCPDIDQAGFLAPGQSRETGNLVVARTCGFHDHDNPGQQTVQGQIVIR